MNEQLELLRALYTDDRFFEARGCLYHMKESDCSFSVLCTWLTTAEAKGCLYCVNESDWSFSVLDC